MQQIIWGELFTQMPYKLPGKCDRITGQCEGGCITGWTGNSCNQRINRQSCEESLKNILIVNVLISTAIIVTGSVINFIIWKRNAAKNAQMG
uniref:EGF-like domain-containing protein n=1 Tax=Magallana gigas TaxID=29159 RepID=A0A8W8MM21_MAGGI